MKNNNKKAFSLPEVTIALLILAMAVLPLIGTISNDSKNAVVIANSEFAMQKARYILDTMLDSVDFDDLGSGDPAKLTGDSKKKYYSSMFPEPVGDGICQGYITDDKGQKFLVHLKVVDIPDSKLNYSYYKTPKDMFGYATWTSENPSGNLSYGVQYQPWEYAIKFEEQNRPSFAIFSFYDNYLSKYTKETNVEKLKTKDFYKNTTLKLTTLMKTLILNIKWNDKNKKNPEQKGYREFNLVTNKARLKK